MSDPLVSVIVPTHDRSALLRRAVTSALTQTWTRVEVVVVDDGSTDDTQDVVDQLVAGDRRVRGVRVDRAKGGSAARNRGLDIAGGEVAAFLDDDDVWLPQKLERQLDHLARHRHLSAVSCHHEIVAPGGPRLVYRGPVDVTADDLLWDNFPGSASFCLWRRDAFAAEPRFDERLPSCQDWDVWLKCAAAGPVAAVPEVLCRYDAHDGPRITGSDRARAAGRRHIVDRYGSDMSSDCRAFNDARISLLERHGGLEQLLAVARPALRGRPRAAFILAAASAAGRRGDRAGDPGRGSRRLHELVREQRQ